MKRYLIMAGGTGGHIFPALAVAEVLQDKGNEVIWLGSQDSMEERLLPKYGFPLEIIPMKGLRGKGLKRMVEMPGMLISSIRDVKKIIDRYHIAAAIGFGGFVTFPGGVAAYLKGIPLAVHEQNAIPGLANRLLSKIAKRVFYAFPDTFSDKEGYVGNPVRQEIVALPLPALRFEGRRGPLRLLVLGGSLGAEVFNQRLPAIIAHLKYGDRPIILHQTGENRQQEVEKSYRRAGVEAQVVGFIQDIASVYSETDYLICRAGALTLSELEAAGLGGFLVPYPLAVDDHQTKNGQVFASLGAGVVVAQPHFTEETMVEQLRSLSRQRCLSWAQQAREASKSDAAFKIASALIALTEVQKKK
ncbi:MAG: undecaprenyldiphospho-muramoylpentapeptide beta-N-acetylglucosaminyltransferase [Haemophilus parainfluenzae]|nr:MAG: undecaprenyldiphospho-muramoylpentapeptide beta-N-acetylglucosaminyltransferase [Haemophilus parainfluenzae]